MSKSISFLLGAGFSAPMGYPIGEQLNEKLLSTTSGIFGFSTAGSLYLLNENQNFRSVNRTSYDIEFDFCLDLMHFFNDTRGYFNYEEFYDFFNFEAKNDEKVREFFKTKTHRDNPSLENLLFSIKNIYTQLVTYYLKDGDGNSWYDTEPYRLGPTWPGYTGILDCFRKFGEDYVVNVHTLNHDLFFERLNNSEWFAGSICDGFEELGSPYYGDLQTGSRRYKCRLQYYTENYPDKFRLYKLHGSRDYGVYYKGDGTVLTPEKYIKTRWGIGFNELFKETQDQNGVLMYESCWINYHADFLTGTTSKIERYREPLLFNILFDYFRRNLKEAEKFIIIGYGGRDSEINKMVVENFDFKNKPAFIIDPFPGADIKSFGESIGAKLLQMQLNDIRIDDLQ